MRVLGVDPGKSGALTVVAPSASGGFQWSGMDMPIMGDDVDIVVIHRWLNRMQPSVAFIESVTGRRGEAQQNVFAFGGAAYAPRYACHLLNIPITFVGSLGWKNYHGLTVKRTPAERERLKIDKAYQSEVRRQAKAASRAKAIELVPEDADLFAKVSSDNLAESLLIALYGLAKMTAPAKRKRQPELAF